MSTLVAGQENTEMTELVGYIELAFVVQAPGPGGVCLHPAPSSSSLSTLSICFSAVMCLPPTCSVEAPAHSYLTLPLPKKPTHPSPKQSNRHVLSCSCVLTCTLSTLYMFLCVFECLRLWCVYTRKEGVLWVTDITHPPLFVYNIATVVACSQCSFPGRVQPPL